MRRAAWTLCVGSTLCAYSPSVQAQGPGLPAVGTPIHSVLLHFDPNLAGLPFSLTQGIARSASITFDRPILGIYVTSQALIATDASLTPGGVAYSTDAARDMEFNYAGDAYSVSPDRSTLSLTMYGHNGGRFDEARIVLAGPPTEVPVLPRSGWVLLGAGLAAFFAMRRSLYNETRSEDS